ncbi:MAG: hypothetical protein K2W81_03775 [Sphingomonas sp.]|uniref:hypothetical protein n=1 Tax=Sphingomonas sp. TaxID=28214 RepID=UPI0025CD9DA3|nr:hypothetical protein [Sphingomonas sp.]MBY0283066.1 hypothetical protein [Sphingomonas sp.]
MRFGLPTGHQLAVLFATLALVCRVAVPTGFMVDEGSAGPTIVICSGSGPMTMPLPGVPAKPDGKADKAGHPCVFAAAHVAAPAPVPSGDALVLRAAPAAPMAPSGDLRPGLGLAAPPPPKTGPPTLR